MSNRDENRWDDAAIVATCPDCGASAETPVPVDHKRTCIRFHLLQLERAIDLEHSGGWTVEESNK